MKAGTIVRLPDGREGTVVYHGLDGYGIKWGRISVDAEMIGAANTLFGDPPPDWPYLPDAMLRDPFKTTGKYLPCIGSDYEVVPQGDE